MIIEDELHPSPILINNFPEKIFATFNHIPLLLVTSVTMLHVDWTWQGLESPQVLHPSLLANKAGPFSK